MQIADARHCLLSRAVQAPLSNNITSSFGIGVCASYDATVLFFLFLIRFMSSSISFNAGLLMDHPFGACVRYFQKVFMLLSRRRFVMIPGLPHLAAQGIH
jgi:hypothetical protein